MILTADELQKIVAQAVREYPRMSCGAVVVRGDDRRIVPCQNIDGEFNLAYVGPLAEQGFTIAVIYYSKVEEGSSFSDARRRHALVNTAAAYPRAAYVVTSVVDGRAEAVAAFRWEATRGDFVNVDLGLAAPIPAAAEGVFGVAAGLSAERTGDGLRGAREFTDSSRPLTAAGGGGEARRSGTRLGPLDVFLLLVFVLGGSLITGWYTLSRINSGRFSVWDIPYAAFPLSFTVLFGGDALIRMGVLPEEDRPKLGKLTMILFSLWAIPLGIRLFLFWLGMQRLSFFGESP